MDDPLDVDPDVGVLEARDALPAPMTVGEEGEGVARDLLEDGVVRTSRQGHAYLGGGRPSHGHGADPVG